MAEVLGLASAVASLVALVGQVSKLSYNFLSDVKNASKSQKLYLQETSALTEVLLRIENALEVQGLVAFRPSSTFNHTLADCHNLLLSLKASLEKATEGASQMAKIKSSLKWPFGEKEVRSTVETLRRHRDVLVAALAADNFIVSVATYSKVDQLTQEKNYERIIQWLGDPSLPRSSAALYESACPGTGQWFLAHDEYLAWRDGLTSLLWCHGHPGTGKTIISSIIIDNLLSVVRNLPASTVLYHFCDLTVRKSIEILQSFLRQTLHAGSRHQLSLLEQCCKHSNTPSLRELSMTLSDIARLNQNTFIVVDALDEFEDRKSLIPILRGLTKAGIKLLVTSRNIPDIRDAFQSEKSLEIQADRSDLELYVGSRLTESDHYESLNPNAGIISGIIDQAGGMFLLVRLVMDHVLNCINVKQIRQALQSLPSNLADAYESTFKRILEQSPNRANLATKVIGWVTHAEERLKVEELRHALAVEEDAGNIDLENLTATRIILQVCIGLLYVDPADNTISMVHLTAYEYFRQLKDQYSQMQLEMAKMCMDYLGYRPICDGTCSNIEALQDRFRSMPLLGYAAKHWGDHARQVEQEVSSRILQVLKDEGIRGSSFQALQYQDLRNPELAAALFESSPTRLEPLHIAAYWNLVMTGENFLREGVDPNILDAQGWTPLHWACSRGSEEMMNTLLEYGASIDARDASGWTPLFWATIKGHEQTVTRLLHENANHLLVDLNGWTALHWAASKGNAHIPQILLDHHSKVKARQKPVRIRVKDVTVETAEIMLKSDTSHNVIKTPLEIAAETQDVSTFDTILEDLAARGAGKTFNELWAQKGWDDPRVFSTWRIMSKADYADGKGLRRYDINQKSDSSVVWKTNLLHGAIRDGKALIVHLLVELGADLQRPYREKTPLEHASLLEDPEITKILLENGAYVPGAPDAGRSLYSALSRGFDRTVEALLQGGIDVNVRGDGGKTPLISACGIYTRSDDHSLRSLPLAIVKMLIHHGADVCAIDDMKSNALHFALEDKAPDVQIIKFLLESGVDANAVNSAGFTPFHNFCKGSHAWQTLVHRDMEETFELLLAHSLSGVENIECHQVTGDRDSAIESPLAIALNAENWPVFHLLLAKGAILRTCRSADDLLAKSAWYWALQPKAVEMLLTLGASAKARMYSGSIPMGHRALEGLLHENSKTGSRFEDFKTILDMYVNYGMDVNATSIGNQSLLHVAVTKVEEDYESALTQYLLDVGVNPYQPSCGVWDAFLFATIHGRLSALRVLISHAAKNPNPDHWLRLPESSTLLEDSDITESIYTSLGRAQCLESPDGSGSTPLQKAVELGKTSTAAALVAHSANLHTTDHYGWTLLHTATYNRDFPTTKLLLSVGASPMATTSRWAHDFGRPSGLGRGQPWTGTPLHLAAMFGDSAIASLLLAHGADVHASTGQGGKYCWGHGPTALHIALDTGKFYGDRQSLGKGILEVARMLVEHGAGVVDVAEHLSLSDVRRFRGFEELWDKLRAGIRSGGNTFQCLDGKAVR